MKQGKFFGIGVGPGDTELLTIKAAKILRNIEVNLFSQGLQNLKKFSPINSSTGFK